MIVVYPNFQNFILYIYLVQNMKINDKGKEKNANTDILRKYKIFYFNFQMLRNSSVYFPQMV